MKVHRNKLFIIFIVIMVLFTYPNPETKDAYADNSSPAVAAQKSAPAKDPTVVTVEGIDFPVRDSFLQAKQALSDWDGAYGSWSELERKVDGKILASTDLIISSDRIEFTHLVAGSDGVNLKKSGKGYTISISVKLSGSVLKEQNAEILKAMIATISSKPFQVYTAIYDSFTSDRTHGINKKKYVTIGDSKIKVRIKDGVVSYLIKKA